jgi:hypothetical protein
MVHRFPTWWRALSVVLLSLATVTWPSAARASTTPGFTVVHQGPFALLSSRGVASFSTTLHLFPANDTANARVSIYPALVTESGLDLVVSGAGTTQRALASTGTFALKCARHGDVRFGVTVVTRGRHPPQRTCDGPAPQLRVRCGATCAGVYPLRYSVTVGGVTKPEWSLLSIGPSGVARPVDVALIETLDHNSLQHPLRAIATLQQLGHFAGSPVTLSADYESLVAIELDQGATAQWRSALEASLESPLHRAVDAPPSSIDFAGLAAHGLTTQVPQQFTLSGNLLEKLTGRYVDEPVLLSGAQSPGGLLALDRAGISDVVLPENDLTEAPSNTLTWGAPFHVAGAGDVSALSVNEPVSLLMDETSISPGRRAALLLASLAFLHFEEPNAPASRSVVIQSSVGATSTRFMSDLLSGLRHDPFDRLSPLTPLFNSSLVGTNNAPRVRALNVVTSHSTWSVHNVDSLLHLIGEVNSYAQGVKSGAVPVELRVAVARSEILANPAQRQALIDSTQNQLDAQLAQFSIDAGAITLAGAGTSLPITVISHANYTVDAVVHLVTDGLTFPKGGDIGIIMNSPTQSIRVPTSNPLGSSLTLQVLLTTPNDQVVLARTAIQVRIAGTSVVGYLLTFGSLFVLALWWWRTNRRRTHKGRHAR